MTDQLKEMGMRMRGLREIMDYTSIEVAERLNISEEEYLAYENGEKDFSFSMMYNVAKMFGVDVVTLLEGDAPHLTGCSLVRKGKGFKIERNKAYDYKHLAFTFKNKMAEPFMVTIEPTTKEVKAHSHPGQEFNYIVSGKLLFELGEIQYELEEGDSVYFDSSIPHREFAMGDKAVKFIAVVLDKR